KGGHEAAEIERLRNEIGELRLPGIEMADAADLVQAVLVGKTFGFEDFRVLPLLDQEIVGISGVELVREIDLRAEARLVLADEQRVLAVDFLHRPPRPAP